MSDYIEDMVIHMHGGGFIVLSSNGTQIYTREWANITKVPVFSIDYRLAPKYPFPEALYDCLRVYEFLVNKIHKFFRIRPKNIFVGGDSAGGNLSCGLTLLLLKKNLPLPKGLLLVYPNLDTRRNFYGSRNKILFEPLLWPSMIKLVMKSYLPNEK